ncbi:MAG: UDP-glucose 6-dehydrogenase [uncultured Sulfurovum sp.]|uniref:UDP-glucose 6-dehydrogenase n=1 Tax=uncultured Sulfurovum sp. TaxID=269237 RepID=A0A6S6UAQ9_9BACT|nr:MAG: UDP-glucose 6-dehydrogenase [uncultured Sulfurovum sp.]
MKGHNMKVTVMGIDYNHLLSGKALAEMGNEVTYISNDHKRIENIRRGYYNADEAMVIKSMNIENSFGFSADIRKSLSTTNMCFISESIFENSEEQMEHILNTARMVGENMSHHMFIIDRSEESMSRVAEIKQIIQEELSKRNTSLTFEVIADPNFLRT